MRIGLFGGTFNPIHRGHLLLAEGAERILKLDEVWFIPAHLPPHKGVEGQVSAEERARMVELAIQGNPRFRLCRAELDRPAPSYTIDTVRQLQRERPGFGKRRPRGLAPFSPPLVKKCLTPFPGMEWFFLVGSDTARDLSTWREAEELMKRVRFIAIPRPGTAGRTPLPAGVLEIPVETADLSSSLLRERLRRGDPLADSIPEPALAYIRQRGLYR